MPDSIRFLGLVSSAFVIHLPLKNALIKYKDDKKKLMELLSTVLYRCPTRRVTRVHRVIRRMAYMESWVRRHGTEKSSGLHRDYGS